MHRCYSIWQRNGIDSRVNYLRMLRAAVELAAMQLENPFSEEDDVVPAEETLAEEAAVEPEQITAEDASTETSPAATVRHIFGVLPIKKTTEVK